VSVPEIDVAGLAAEQANGAYVLDVRQPEEYESGHVPGAVLVPLGEVPDRVAEVPTTEPVYVVCRSGARSRRAAEFLIARGIDATNVAGGTMAWMEAGHGVVTGLQPGESASRP
jgi:rhodanese-related sulfurtransferase